MSLVNGQKSSPKPANTNPMMTKSPTATMSNSENMPTPYTTITSPLPVPTSCCFTHTVTRQPSTCYGPERKPRMCPPPPPCIRQHFQWAPASNPACPITPQVIVSYTDCLPCPGCDYVCARELLIPNIDKLMRADAFFSWPRDLPTAQVAVI